jgi:hypothetical protein
MLRVSVVDVLGDVVLLLVRAHRKSAVSDMRRLMSKVNCATLGLRYVIKASDDQSPSVMILEGSTSTMNKDMTAPEWI